MEPIILVIHLIVALAIIAVVLLQPSETGGFLGSGGTMSNMMAPRRGADIMTRITTILAVIFFVTSLALAIIAENNAPKKSILDVATETTTKVAPTEKAKPAEPKKEKPSAPISK